MQPTIGAASQIKSILTKSILPLRTATAVARRGTTVLYYLLAQRYPKMEVANSCESSNLGINVVRATGFATDGEVFFWFVGCSSLLVKAPLQSYYKWSKER